MAKKKLTLGEKYPGQYEAEERKKKKLALGEKYRGQYEAEEKKKKKPIKAIHKMPNGKMMAGSATKTVKKVVKKLNG